MAGMSLNDDLSELFSSFASLLELSGANAFRVIAFQRVARVLEDHTIDVKQAYDNGTLEDIDGIGDSSRDIIREFISTGHTHEYDELLASIPAGLLPMLQIPGLGPKTVRLLWHERGITSIEQLSQAIDTGKLAGLKGIGEKKIASIKQGIAFRAQAGERKGLVEALPIAHSLVEQVRKLPQVKHAEIAGSLRRWRETVGDVDLLCAVDDADDGEAVSAAFVAFPEVDRILGQGGTKASIVTKDGLQVDLRIVPEVNFGAALLYFTGSKEHSVEIRTLAQAKDMTLNEWGLYSIKAYEKAEKKKPGHAPSAKPLASRTEQDIYEKLGLAYVEPELREGRGEVDAAQTNKLPTLIVRADLRGDLHMHTTASDGNASIEQMAEAAAALGYEYIAITDHSKSQVIAKGLSVAALHKHIKAIRHVAERVKGQITLLAGSEVDILVDGKMDYEDAVLAELDVVIASPHASLSQDEKKATDRLVRAIENRYVTVIGHPTGRYIGRRAGLPLDFSRIFPAAAQTGTALEINASWPRLDLSATNARGAIEQGVMLSIGTDAHSTEGLDGIGLGIRTARRGWVEKKNVINCLPLAQLRKFIDAKRNA